MTEDDRKLLDKLMTLLESSDSECFEFIDDLRLIPGSEDIIALIEEFDFEAAAKALDKFINNS